MKTFWIDRIDPDDPNPSCVKVFDEDLMEYKHWLKVIDFESYEKLKELTKLMLDPENDPPQFSKEEAWEKFKELMRL